MRKGIHKMITSSIIFVADIPQKYASRLMHCGENKKFGSQAATIG